MTEDELIKAIACAACEADGGDPLQVTPSYNLHREDDPPVDSPRWHSWAHEARRFLAMMRAYEEVEDGGDGDDDPEAMAKAKARLREAVAKLPKTEEG